ncbi:hypothetical protein V9T40_010420 [Parthenolecanium corni]|uniref:HTH CENPB-type domain-containing protein n=1 Tax=Parthenolecanium corni TaxID=536013 RepID=A0AAN9Y1E4_9HEMI
MADKRKIGNFDHETMRKAVLKVVKNGYTIRGAAKEFKLSYATLRQYVSRYNAADDKERDTIRFSPNYEVNLVFSEKLENELVQYLIVARRLRYSLTGEDVRRLSYDLAVKHKLRIPPPWKKSNKAGKHWMYAFLKRHPKIKKILNLSKKFRPTDHASTPNPLSKKKNLNSRDELIVDDENLENFIESDEEEVDLLSKAVIIIPMRKRKSRP